MMSANCTNRCRRHTCRIRCRCRNLLPILFRQPCAWCLKPTSTRKQRSLRQRRSSSGLPTTIDGERTRAPADCKMKLFTVQEANALLPSVRVILAKIQRAHRRLSHYRDDARKAAEAAEQGGGGIVDGVRYAEILHELTSQMAELEGLGVQLK